MPAHAEHIGMLEDGKTAARTVIVALYDSHREAEEAVRGLHRAGFDMQKLSIVGKEYQTKEEVTGYYAAASDRMKAWGKTGAFWGGLWGLLFGSAFLFIRGFGPLLAAGPLVGSIFEALEGAVVVDGVSALGAGLYSMGIPKDNIIEYEKQVQAGRFVIVTHGSTDEVNKTKATLAWTKHSGMKEYACRSEPTLTPS